MRRLVYLLLILIMVYCGMRQAIIELAIKTASGPAWLTLLNSLILFYNDSTINYAVAVGSLIVIAALRQVKIAPKQSIDDLRKQLIKQGKIIVAENPKDAFLKVFSNIKFKEATT